MKLDATDLLTPIRCKHALTIKDVLKSNGLISTPECIQGQVGTQQKRQTLNLSEKGA